MNRPVSFALGVFILFSACMPDDSGPEGTPSDGGGGVVTCETGLAAGNEFMVYWRGMTALYCGIHPDEQEDATAEQGLCLSIYLGAGLVNQAHVQQNAACFDRGQGEDCLVAMSPFQGDDGFFRDDCDLSDQERAQKQALETSGSCSRVIQGRLAAGGRCGTDDGQGNTTESDTVCEGDLRCIEAVCATPLSDGDLCAESDDCRDGLYCGDSGFCAVRFSLGEFCDTDEQCESGHCSLQSEACVAQCQ